MSDTRNDAVRNASIRTPDGIRPVRAYRTAETVPTSDPQRRVRLWAAPSGEVFVERQDGGLDEEGGWAGEGRAWSGVWPTHETASSLEEVAYQRAVEEAQSWARQHALEARDPHAVEILDRWIHPDLAGRQVPVDIFGAAPKGGA